MKFVFSLLHRPFWLHLLRHVNRHIYIYMNFYTPVFRRDVLWYGDVRPSVRPFSALFSYMLWHNELKFCTWLCFNVLQIKFECRHFASIFICPSSDGKYYGMVMSVRPSVRVSVRPFSALFSYMLWHIELEFCTWLCFNVLQIKFECRHFASIFEGVMPLCELRIYVMCSFPHFSPTCFDILSWNFAYDFVLLYYRSSSSVVNFRQFL